MEIKPELINRIKEINKQALITQILGTELIDIIYNKYTDVYNETKSTIKVSNTLKRVECTK